MAAYARRHYGIDSYRLRDPKVIVEHYTVTATFQQTFNTFAPDHPDPSSTSCPGTCAHYVIDRDGTIYQLVPRSIMCRHTVGPELHGDRDRARRLQRRRDPAQQAPAMAASLRLTRWLRCRYGIGDQERDRAQRDALLAVSPRARRAARNADPRRHGRARRCGRIGRKLANAAPAEYVEQHANRSRRSSLCWPSVAADAADAATKRPRLKAFSSCKQLVDYARAGALRTDGRRRRRPARAAPIAGRRGHDAADLPADDAGNAAATSRPAAAPGRRPRAPRGGAVPDFSGTNVQELGVDEPDVIKTDGRRIFAVTDRTLRVIDAASGTVTGTLALDGDGHRLLLRGDRVLVIASKGAAPTRPGRPADRAGVRAAREHARSSPRSTSARAPKVMRTMEVAGPLRRRAPERRRRAARDRLRAAADRRSPDERAA